VPCDDGDPCTDDACIAGVCDNVLKTGLDAVTCTCDRTQPEVCADQSLPRSVARYTTRACRLFADALDATPRRQRRRLRQGARALRRATAAVVHAQRHGLAPECAAALAEQYRDASDRASIAADRI
jgi:hypothetical protein